MKYRYKYRYNIYIYIYLFIYTHVELCNLSSSVPCPCPINNYRAPGGAPRAGFSGSAWPVRTRRCLERGDPYLCIALEVPRAQARDGSVGLSINGDTQNHGKTMGNHGKTIGKWWLFMGILWELTQAGSVKIANWKMAQSK